MEINYDTTTTTTADGSGWLGTMSEPQLRAMLDAQTREQAGEDERGDRCAQSAPADYDTSAAGRPLCETTATRLLDRWCEQPASCARIHCKPRRELFTPLRVAGAPPAQELFTVRATVGRYVASGQIFKIIDSWHNRSEAHRDMGEMWTGIAQFLRRTGDVL